ncbi:uncharacterized protein LOC115670445 [Syzygium oleosum]|uniref:uncharacterized protein LOC115670445 n=1 Tax=Syzygium oleosum TaxID=219896 RepID=UPI0024B97D63|nr:uncharacterized protein LOC115670445 [Syzygium oleosum]
MALEAEKVLACICRILSLSARAGYTFIQKRPLGSVIASFFLLLYLFFPFVFKLLMFSIPVAFSAIALVRVLSRDGTGSLRIPNASKDEKGNRAFTPVKRNTSEEGATNTAHQYQKPLIQAQMSKRRNFKTKREDPDAEGGGAKEVKRVTFSTTCDDSLIGGDRKDQENDPGLLFGGGSCSLGKGESSISHESDRGDLQPVNEHPLTSESGDLKPEIEVSNDDKGGVTGQLEADILAEAEYEDEEEAQEDGNKAVEWTEDDQKNLMDLGLSELERNQRLENLIAKRRARKFMGTKVQENLLDLDIGPAGYIPPVQISKNPFDPPSCSDRALDSQIPSSAPSVMLPARNPFDLPYDPQEEKPNLTVDGFQGEFLANQPKDIFCRHESFFLGPSFSVETSLDQVLRNADPYSVTENRALREPQFPRFRRFSAKGDHDRLVEQILYRRDYGMGSSKAEHETKPENDNGGGAGLEDKRDGAEDIELKVFKDENQAGSIDEEDGDQSSISTSDSDGQATSGDGNEVLISPKFPDTATISVHKTFEYSVPNGIATDGDLSSPLAMDNLEKRTGHSSTYSIASDMQVEVSESSSPRTVDYATSPAELECSTNSEDVGKEVTPCSEEIWGALSHLTGVEEDEPKGDIDNFKANDSSKDPFGSSISLQELCKEDSADGVFTTTSLKVTVPTEGPDISDSHDKSHTMGSDYPPEAKDLQSTPPAQNLVPHQAEERQSQKTEESVNPLEKSTGEANSTQGDMDSSDSNKEEVDNLKTSGES